MWGNPDPPEMQMVDFVALATAPQGFLSKEEVRKHLAKSHSIELKDVGQL